MGVFQSKLTKKQMEEIIQKTNFSKQEIKHWFKGFMKDCPSGKLTLIEFNEIYRQFFPAGDPTQFASFVFELFDEDKSGEIEFSEFLLALSITAKGEMEDKLEWAFKLYDRDNNGTVDEGEMLEVVQAIYAMTAEAHNECAHDRVKKIFEIIDEDKNGVLSKEEFFAAARKDSSILAAFQ